MDVRKGLIVTMMAALVFSSAGLAVALAEPAPAASPASALQLLAQAQSEAALGHNDTAKQILIQAATLYPEDMGIQKLLGDVQYRLENYTAAATAYQTVLAHNPNDKEVHNRLGGVYAALDRYDDAIAEFRKSLPLPAGFLNLVQVYDDEGRLGTLEDECNADLSRDPNNPVYHLNLGLILAYEKKLNRAQEEFQAALDLNPNFNDARNGLGTVYGDMGRSQDAIAQYRIVIISDPEVYVRVDELGGRTHRAGQVR